MGIWSSILGTITGPLAQSLSSWLAAKEATKQKKLELDEAVHQRQIELISQGLAADASWELAQVNSSGWKDEYVLIVLSIPLIGCFIPGIAPYILRGFEILAKTPNWYLFMVQAIFLAVYGIRLWRRNQSDT